MNKFTTWLKKEITHTSVLLRNIPSLIVTFFVVAVISMNLLANKTIVNEPYIALDGGILVSWLSFLAMDVITKHYGPKASTRVSILATLVNLLACAIFFTVSIIPTVDDYSGFNSIFGGTWFILLGSTIAFLASAVINNFLNAAVGKMFKKNPDSKLAFVTRTYTSTVAGQFFDNLIFATIVFMFFAPIFWDGFSWTLVQCVMCSLTGAVIELLFEIIFSPFGYRISKRWKKEDIGRGYFNYLESISKAK